VTFAGRRGHRSSIGRLVSIAVLTSAAVAISVTGISIADLQRGQSVLPGADRAGTFPGIREVSMPAVTPTIDPPRGRDPSPTEPARDLRIEVSATSMSCGSAEIGESTGCAGVTVTGRGEDPLRIGDVDVTGPARGDFEVTGCSGARLTLDESCELDVTFTPTRARAPTGDRRRPPEPSRRTPGPRSASPVTARRSSTHRRAVTGSPSTGPGTGDTDPAPIPAR
jgi:hypothetical protein